MTRDEMVSGEIEWLILRAGKVNAASPGVLKPGATGAVSEEVAAEHAAQQALQRVLPSKADWEDPREELFSARAREVALVLGDQARNGLMGLVRDLRSWDERVDRREDVFQLFAPLLRVAAARRREFDERKSHLYAVRLHLADTVTSAQALYVARWFFETVRSFQNIEFARHRETRA